MSSIGDSQNPVQTILARNGSQAGGGFFGVCALGLGDDLVLRDPMGQKGSHGRRPLRNLADHRRRPE